MNEDILDGELSTSFPIDRKCQTSKREEAAYKKRRVCARLRDLPSVQIMLVHQHEATPAVGLDMCLKEVESLTRLTVSIV